VDDFTRAVSNKIKRRKLAATLAEARSDTWDAEGKFSLNAPHKSRV
jgi:hypothetical protein